MDSISANSSLASTSNKLKSAWWNLKPALTWANIRSMRARLNLSLKPIRRMIESSSNLFRLFFTDNYFSIFIYKKEFLCLLFFFSSLVFKEEEFNSCCQWLLNSLFNYFSTIWFPCTFFFIQILMYFFHHTVVPKIQLIKIHFWLTYK